MATISAAISNFSKWPKEAEVHPADSERVHHNLPKSVENNLMKYFEVHQYFCPATLITKLYW